jgi:hypothetical protein
MSHCVIKEVTIEDHRFYVRSINPSMGEEVWTTKHSGKGNCKIKDEINQFTCY